MTQFSSLYGSCLDEELGTDDRSILFTIARRKSAINKGAAKFATLTNCLSRTAAIAVVSGTSEYNLNSTTIVASGDFQDFDVIPPELVSVDTSSNTTIIAGRDTFLRRDIDWLNQNEPSWDQPLVSTSAQQMPRFWYVRSDADKKLIGLAPGPVFSTTTGVLLNLPYIANAPVMVNDTDQPYTFSGASRTDLNNYHQGLVHYATYQLEKLRKDVQASQGQLQMFMGFVAQYLQDQRIKGGRQIRQARSYFKAFRKSMGSGNAWTGR